MEKRQLQITDKLFEFVCKELQIPAYFVDTVLRDDQLGRLGFGSYLHPGKDQVPGSFGKAVFYVSSVETATANGFFPVLQSYPTAMRPDYGTVPWI